MARSDLDLLDAWRDGDLTAADALIKRHFGPLCRFFRNKIDRGIEDLIQTTLLTCVERRDRFPEGWSFRTFLFVVARDQLYMYWRKQNRKGVQIEPGITSVVDLNPSPSAVAAKQSEQRLVLDALRRIPMDLQIALELHYWEGLKGPELARVLDIPEGTVRSRLRRARQLMGERMKELASNEEQLERTMSDLDRWASSIRGALGRDTPVGS